MTIFTLARSLAGPEILSYCNRFLPNRHAVVLHHSCKGFNQLFSGSGHCPLILSDMRQLMKTGVAVEKLFSRDFTNEIRSQVIESSFAVGAEIHRNYWFGSFFNKPRYKQ